MSNNELSPTRLHALDGDHDDVGYWSRGHHAEDAMRAAVAQAYPPETRHTCAAEPDGCSYFRGWWRRVPRGDGAQFYRAKEGDRGVFAVTALLTPEAQI
jgi:hypothetical protein